MAEIVAAFGVPHTPMFPSMVAKAGPDCETAGSMPISPGIFAPPSPTCW